MMRALLCGMLLAGAALTAGCATTGAGAASNVPPIALQDIDGRTHYLNDSIGQKVVVMAFWATWCMPCRQELALLKEIYDEQRANGLEVLAISIDTAETAAGVGPFARQQGFTFPVLLDSDTRASALYNQRKQAPYLHIFDRSGRIVYSHDQYQPSKAAALKTKIVEVLGSK